MRRVVLIVFVLAALMCAQTTKKINTSTKNSTAQSAERVNDTQSKLEFYPTMGYQGLLKDNQGKLVEDGNYTVSFKIYDSEDGETALWKEVQEVTITGGVINCYIGAVEKLNLPFDKQYWLSVSVGDDELPRMIMSGTPYSLHARRIAEDAIVGGKNISVSKDEDGKIVLSGEGGSKTAANLLDTWANMAETVNGCGTKNKTTCYNYNLAEDSIATYSHAFGYLTRAYGYASFTAGQGTRAGGNYSTAFGKNTFAFGNYSSALGYASKVMGDYSFITGANCTSLENFAITMGYQLENDYEKSFMVGWSNPQFFIKDDDFICMGFSQSDIDNNIFPNDDIPANSLLVNGTVFAKELELSTQVWPDYVFEDNYNLKPLNEVDAFIKANKHLPGIVPKKEALENGVNVGDIQVKLLEKIEELTLYIIDQDKQMKDLQSKIK